MATTESQVVKLMAEEIVNAIKSYVGTNNKTYVNNQINNSTSAYSSSSSYASYAGSVNASNVLGLYDTVGSYITNVQSQAESGDETAQQILYTLSGISNICIKNATIDTAHIENLYASYGEFINLVAEKAEIEEVDTGKIYAELADIGISNIEEADIGYAQIKDLVAGTAIITEGVSGQLYIDRLAVTDANMVSLTTGELVLKDSDGNFVKIVVDSEGKVSGEKVTFDGDDILVDGSTSGSKLIAGTITARELNVKKIFADEALLKAIKASNIDVSDLFANNAFISELETSVIKNANIGENIDISKNSSITLTNSKIDLVVNSESSSSELKLTDNMISAISDEIDVRANDIDLSANESVKITTDKLNAITTGDITFGSATSINLTSKTVKVSSDNFTIDNNTMSDVISEAKTEATGYLSYSDNKLSLGYKVQDNTVSSIELSSDGMDILDKDGTSLASYGSEARIGKSKSNNITIDDSSLKAYNSFGEEYFSVDENGIKFGSSEEPISCASTDSIKQVNEAVDSLQKETNSMIRISSGGIEVGDSNNERNVFISSNDVQIRKNDVKLAVFDDDSVSFPATNTEFQSNGLVLGGFKILIDDNGLSFKYDR